MHLQRVIEGKPTKLLPLLGTPGQHGFTGIPYIGILMKDLVFLEEKKLLMHRNRIYLPSCLQTFRMVVGTLAYAAEPNEDLVPDVFLQQQILSALQVDESKCNEKYLDSVSNVIKPRVARTKSAVPRSVLERGSLPCSPGAESK